MNQRDQMNLNFLLNIGDGLREWFDSASLDDRVYAEQLLDAYEKELNLAWIQESLDPEHEPVVVSLSAEVH